MANVNKKRVVSQQQGLPTLEAIMAHKGGDNVPAVMSNSNGSQQPAALTEGEFVFSIPAIIALGKGNYEQGVGLLEQMHNELKQIGESMMPENSGGLSAAI